MLDNIDKRHAEITAVMPSMLPARADFYRAYDDFVAFLIGEFGTYKVVNAQFIFPYQRAVERYNAAANAMTAAAKRVAGLEAERKALVNRRRRDGCSSSRPLKTYAVSGTRYQEILTMEGQMKFRQSP